jgi:DNA-binding CsgD family transcriptional regulator
VDYVTKPIVPDELIARMRAHLANARLMSSARDALDLSGRALFSLGPDGAVGWRTPEAARALTQVAGETGHAGRLPGRLHEQLFAALARAGDPQRTPAVAIEAQGRRLLLRPLGRTTSDAILVGVEVADSAGGDARLRDRFGLTARECEVLMWIARGKSNRDIGEILALSPRTVNKHLEHIYVKLGVENRASAAAVVIGVLAERAVP